ncbi:MAG: (R)-2-hydroxyacyl-CoA dehydratese activating ATPase, partial [Candidatus Binataceae bacterium]|nr:(R)-2-hydroxyacyl-CoA dehydratese activating ATPase [Candidatus Binataceae bacterium]
MPSFVMGVDFGSTTGKAVILDGDGKVVASSVASKGSVSDEGVQIAIAEALERAG